MPEQSTRTLLLVGAGAILGVVATVAFMNADVGRSGEALAAPSAGEQPADTKTDRPIMDMFRDSRDAVPLDPNDPTSDLSALLRDPADNPQRAPGPVNIQKLIGGLGYQGIPTFFRAPIAMTPEDLRVGEVDVAFLAAPVDMSTGMRGTAYGPQAIRMGDPSTGGAWGDVMPLAHPAVGEIDFMQVLNVVDYGDAPIDILSPERSAVSVHRMVKEIAETGAIPVIIGGDHSLMYPNVVAITDVYGKGNVGVVHFDAHFDGIPLLFGHYLSHGAMVRRLIDEGHVDGKNFVQIGLNSPKPGLKDIEWMRENQVRYHMMAEIDRDGWDVVMERALAEALDGPEYIFISFDTDCFDPAFAPGMGTPETGGLTPREVYPILRALGVQNKVVGVDLVELNPLADPTYRSRQVAVRVLREILTGIAMRERGITDPMYLDKLWINHDVPLGK